MGGLAEGADDGIGGGWRDGLAEDEGEEGGGRLRRGRKDLLMCKRGEIGISGGEQSCPKTLIYKQVQTFKQQSVTDSGNIATRSEPK